MVTSTNYFDDFAALASVGEASSVDHTVKSLFPLLGWKFAEDGSKTPPFSDTLNAQGIRLDVSELHLGKVSIDNTEARRVELADLIEHILQSGELKKMDALKLRGRMQFAAGQLFGQKVLERCDATCVPFRVSGAFSIGDISSAKVQGHACCFCTAGYIHKKFWHLVHLYRCFA